MQVNRGITPGDAMFTCFSCTQCLTPQLEYVNFVIRRIPKGFAVPCQGCSWPARECIILENKNGQETDT